ncbi:MAG: hypothetical protein JWP89_4011 [Schlesneria sp.]|nr:hypothetical protein [Schlesneria sp.]
MIKNCLLRIWTGIVAGAALALMLQVIGLMTIGLPLEYLGWLLVGCSGMGFLLGVIVGPRSTRSKLKSQD